MAVMYMPCDDNDDFYVYVTLCKVDKNGKPILATNVPWSAIPPNSVEEIPEDKISDILLYSSTNCLLRASTAKSTRLARCTSTIHSTHTPLFKRCPRVMF